MNMAYAKLITLTLLTTFLIIYPINCVKHSSINTIYKKGLNAYSGEQWSECITQFEEVIHLYKLFRSININCRLKCNSQLDPAERSIKEDIEDLKIFEIFIKRRNCLEKCRESSLHDVRLDSEVHEDTLDNLRTRKPYQYLHMCYYQMYALPKAASASYTYLVANPDDAVMDENLKYYKEQPEVDESEVTDLESDDYVVLYRLGNKAYEQGNWGETVAAMEEVLVDYLSSENNCRAECERLTKQDWSPEFIVTVTEYIRILLQCKQTCQNSVQSLKFESGTHFLADILNYLQISYYHLDRVKDAAKAVASYLLVSPQDEDMIENKRIYMTLEDEKYFVERPDIFSYYKRDNYEKLLLNYLQESEIDNHIYM